MAKKSKICLAALLLLVLAASLSLAACDPGSFTEMANAQQEFFEKYGEYYTALGAGGLVRYRDKDTGATGYLDQSSGEVVLEARYAYAGDFGKGRSGVAVVSEDGKSFRLIDKNGACLLDGLEDHKFYFDFVIGKKNGSWGVWDKKGRQLIAAEYDDIEMAYGSFVLCRGGRYGLANGEGEIVVPLKYTNILCENNIGEDVDLGGYLIGVSEEGMDYMDLGGEIVRSFDGLVSIMHGGFGRYLQATPSADLGSTRFALLDEELEEIYSLSESFEIGAAKMPDKDTVYVTSGASSYLLNIKTGRLTPATLDESKGVDAYKIGKEYLLYGGGEVTLRVPEAEWGFCHVVFGTFRNYMFNKVTNTLTDLMNGESVTLDREIVDIVDAEEGMFVAENFDGMLAACAKNGKVLTDFRFDDMRAYSDGFVGYRGGVCELYGMDGNLILRSDKIII
ncbi:MAG TPA: WG repeat-containing protein [Candidatus Caccalectryoclostridium excrementigallinarum]|uniref:WG repeat-containing protein n=1 Tax=Candidatus Caccalectryoclostridium excrementigallinarum TaxID=2840710 RepID=A0A9D1SJ49_9FIRM|nr:WG repeat-containing protein [Candidatus Caccalectryoclostridium excrementigallinarum]